MLLVRLRLQEGRLQFLQGLSQLAHHDDALLHGLGGVVDDVNAVLQRLLVEHFGEGHIGHEESLGIHNIKWRTSGFFGLRF